MRLTLALAPRPIELSVQSRTPRPGELVVLSIALSEPTGTVRVRAFDRDWVPFRVDSRTWRVLVGIDLDVAPAAYEVDVTVGSSTACQPSAEWMLPGRSAHRSRSPNWLKTNSG